MLFRSVFITLALSTFAGSEGDDSFRRGLNYNAVLAAAGRQHALGWRSTLSVAGDQRHLRLSLTDRLSQPVTGFGIAATLGRPSTNRFDQPLSFNETAAGQFEANLPAIGSGTFVIDLLVRDPMSPAAEPILQVRQRLWLKPTS